MHEMGAIRVRMAGGSFDPQTFSVVASRPNELPLLGELRGDAFVFDPVPLGSYAVLCDSVRSSSTEHVELTRDGEVAEITLALGEPQTLQGRVIDDTGQAVPDAWVRASRVHKFSFAQSTEPALTDGDGGFVLGGLVPGLYTVVVSGGEGEGRRDGVESGNTNVVVTLERFGSISGSLRDAEGGRVTDFIVAYDRGVANARGEVRGARGSWSLPWLAPGSYQLSSHAANGSALASVQLPPGGALRVALQLAPANEPN
jgi:hypothetical protein